jgi:hypothetical protein
MPSVERFSPPGQRNDEIYISEGDPLSTGETGLAKSSLLVPERNAGLVPAGSKFYPWHMPLTGEVTVRELIDPFLCLRTSRQFSERPLWVGSSLS